MPKSFHNDGLPYENQAALRAAIRPSWKKLLAWYVDRVFNGGLAALNRRMKCFLEPDPSAVVLDVGIGDGDLLLWWARYIGTSHLYGIDAIPNQHADKIKTAIAPLDQPWPYTDRFFDVVISSQNIEHIIDTPLYLNECRRVLKEGGYAIILTENLASWANIAGTMMGWMPFSLTNMFGEPIGNKLVWHQGLPKGDFDKFYSERLWGCIGHQRLFTPLALRHLAERHGFVCEANFGAGYLPFWGIVSEWLSKCDATHSHFIGVKLRKPWKPAFTRVE